MDLLDEKLKHYFGFETFRPGQREIITAILARQNILAILPTGSGKSLCYQLPALMSSGLTIVVSPLIALMRDQVRQLSAHGLTVGAYYFGQEPYESKAVSTALDERRLKLLYISPERLVRPNLHVQLQLAGAARLVIDEAHCVSHWGRQFRPEYREFAPAAEALGIRHFIAVTASADPRTRSDIIRYLFPTEPRLIVHSFDRPNLFLAAQARQREPLHHLWPLLRTHQGQSGIIYTNSRRSVEKVSEQLKSLGIWALPYHGGLDSAQRNAHQDEFLDRSGIIIVATIAFGMGIDKADVRFIAHTHLPLSIEAYYQEIGRAGRDGHPAQTLLLYRAEDMEHRWSAVVNATADIEHDSIDYDRRIEMLALAQTIQCRRQRLLAAFGEIVSPCGNCDNCQAKSRVSPLWRWSLKALNYSSGEALTPTSQTITAWPTVRNTLQKLNRAVALTKGHRSILMAFTIIRKRQRFMLGLKSKLSQLSFPLKSGENISKIAIQKLLLEKGFLEEKFDSDQTIILSAKGQVALTRSLSKDLAFLTKRQRKLAWQILDQYDWLVSEVSLDIGSAVTELPSLSLGQLRLLDQLKQSRKKLARLYKAPLSTIIDDKGLLKMIVQLPRTDAHMLKILNGSEKNFGHYRAEFLQIINKFFENNSSPLV